jgi:CBS domain containing-hemolysin-like protein
VSGEDGLFSIGWRLLAVAVLVGLNGFFVAAEFALVKVRQTQLVPLVARGRRQARVAAYILPRLDAFLSAAQLGITLASLGLGWIGEPVFSAVLRPLFGWLDIAGPEHAALRHSISFGVGFTVITFLHISAGEQAPKWHALQRPLQTSLWVSYPLLWFYRLSYPFVLALNATSQWMLRQVGVRLSSEGEHVHSVDEMRLLFATSRGSAGETALGRTIVLNALDLRRRVVREVMRPRKEIVFLDTVASIAECLDVAEKTRFSRFPLCEGGDVDRMLGVVHTKDLYASRLKARSGVDLAQMAKKLVYVPESARLERVLERLLERRLHMAVVVDEYGGTLGLLTLENILEELVGQIQDEFDQEKPLFVRSGETSWEVTGALPLHELEEIIGEHIPAGEVSTVNGLVTQRLGGFAKSGDVFQLGSCELRVEETDGMSVARLRVTKRTPGAGPATAG